MINIFKTLIRFAKKCTMKPKLGVVGAAFAVGLVVGIPQSADATTSLLQNIAQSHPNLIHQWSFDGADDATRRQDQQGTAHLDEVTTGTGAGVGVGYGVAGFDATSDAVTTYR